MTETKNSQAQFIIPLKQNSTKSFETVSLLILVLSYLSFLFKAFAKYNPPEIIIIAALAAVSFVWYFNIKSGRWAAKYGFIVFVLTGGVWFYQAGIGFAVGALVILAGVLKERVKETPEVTADIDGVAIKNVFAKRYRWIELNNVVIKDGLLTIDCKNNRLFQKDISPNITAEYEAEFNEFCKSKTPSAP